MRRLIQLAPRGIALFSAWALSFAAASAAPVIQHVFVIAMENHDASQIYGNTTDAPYINNTLIPSYAHATNFNDELALSIPSEPHYVWMEAGTNAFSDHTFTGDGNPTSTNSTSSTAHLVTQIKNATSGVTWITYQEGQNSTTGACPIASSGFYGAKHDPFVFFEDVSGIRRRRPTPSARRTASPTARSRRIWRRTTWPPTCVRRETDGSPDCCREPQLLSRSRLPGQRSFGTQNLP